MTHPTSDRLRKEIDSGRSGDKVNFSDPAASPLGTDDEAAGDPPTPAQLAMAAQHELEARPDDPSAGRPARDAESRQRDKARFAVPIVGVLVLIAIILWLTGVA
ncbi:hypothetical protein QCN27_08545 [Cereibacter sp. SYSU M97828]|nr:hypothetical protein [Cereibacter flavus]